MCKCQKEKILCLALNKLAPHDEEAFHCLVGKYYLMSGKEIDKEYKKLIDKVGGLIDFFIKYYGKHPLTIREPFLITDYTNHNNGKCFYCDAEVIINKDEKCVYNLMMATRSYNATCSLCKCKRRIVEDVDQEKDEFWKDMFKI